MSDYREQAVRDVTENCHDYTETENYAIDQRERVLRLEAALAEAREHIYCAHSLHQPKCLECVIKRKIDSLFNK